MISPISVLVLLLPVALVFASATTGGSTYGYDPNHIPADKSAEPNEQEKLLSTTLGIQGIIYCRSGSKLTPLEANDEHGYERAPFSILSDASDDKGYFFATLSPDEVQQNWRLKECRAFLEVSPSETCNVPTDMNQGISGALLTRCEAFDIRGWYTEGSNSVLLRKILRSSECYTVCKIWQLCCSRSISSDVINEVSPERLWEDLRPTLSYLSPKELELVHNALKLAFEARDGQKRRSGEPFIILPVEVAYILGELELDWESVAVGLLHDTVEDTNVVTFERIEEEFSPIVRHIVEGETKVWVDVISFDSHA
ncbi:hypothetical protein EZV62_010367 [Acer yangbiense]|uniref:HD domain-containing protein n=1 Tax=Acer yangbiense TaxID=1000413 RepID=A0A5C7I1H2_9ROSI|nr:hypothetical protein EZV62_010367 [Acer yangbiense]